MQEKLMNMLQGHIRSTEHAMGKYKIQYPYMSINILLVLKSIK